MHILKIHKLITSSNEADKEIGIQLFLRRKRCWYLLLEILGSIILSCLLLPLALSIYIFLCDWKERTGFYFASYQSYLLRIRYDLDLGDLDKSEEEHHIFVTPFTIVRMYIMFDRDNK